MPAALTAMEQELLQTLQTRSADGDDLSGLRCGADVCDLLTGLAAHGLADITRMEQDGAAVRVDVELAADIRSC
ncbi:MAG: hypothetical protein SVU88_03055 [Candidatus Nanohaloarchaea archaeon]|nr:hypothetical protein [Candidatus Nanohaloarchaea archaeon]